MAPKSKSVIPAGHTFVNPDVFISQNGYDTFRKLLERADDRNPDLFDMHIYNDFFSYALLDLIDKTLSKIHTKVVKKDYDEAMPLLEALTAFNDIESSWPMCDDGERVELTNKAYGACLVTTLRGLKKDDRLDTTNFPALESLLKNAAEWGEAMGEMGCDSPYYVVCKAIGRRLFKHKSDDTIILEKARVEEWVAELDKGTQASVKAGMKEAEVEVAEGRVEKSWYAGARSADEDDKDPDYVLTRVWKEYKDHLAGCPTMPLRGPKKWDINKWTAAEKREFSFDNIDI